MAQPPQAILVRGARVNNLKQVDVDVPLGAFVALTGVSGSGKSSLALGVLYAEGSRRYLDGLSTYQRRRIEQAAAPQVDSVSHIPAALALHQRPALPGPRSTVGSLSEVGAVLRLAMSRLGTHLCPNGHMVAMTPRFWARDEVVCPSCDAHFHVPSAESFSSASLGACPRCEGLGVVNEVDESTLVPDASLTIDQGAVAPWRMLGRRHMPLVAQELGVRTDVPWNELNATEQDTVLHGPATKKHIVIKTGTGRPIDVTVPFENAVNSVSQMAARDHGDGSQSGVQRVMVQHRCPECSGSGLNAQARGSRLLGQSLPQLFALSLDALPTLAQQLHDEPGDLQHGAQRLALELNKAVQPLLALGLDYLSADRRGNSLSTGERQRMQLAATAMRQTTGMLYVLDEPSVGLHPAAVAGLLKVFANLVADGNSVVVVDHDVLILEAADQLIELGPEAGEHGGRIIGQGTPAQIAQLPGSRIGPYLSGSASIVVRQQLDAQTAPGQLRLAVSELYNLHDVHASFPLGRLSVLTGPSGAGKSALIMDSLVPAMQAQLAGTKLPAHVSALDAAGLKRLVVSDATPIGANARSTPATYSGVFDEVRKLFAATPLAHERGWKAGHFSFNTAGGRCPTCDGLGELALDLQYLPDLPMPCPTCHGKRFDEATLQVQVDGRSIADVLALTVHEARDVLTQTPKLRRALQNLDEVGLGYLTLGEPTPSLSGGEAQRLRLASELRRGQADTLFVFDEPSIGLHPADVATLLGVFDHLVQHGATLLVIEHDLDLIANADWVLDIGPGGGTRGGQLLFAGSVADLRAHGPDTGIAPWLNAHLQRGKGKAGKD